jgi:hypothetical protein
VTISDSAKPESPAATQETKPEVSSQQSDPLSGKQRPSFPVQVASILQSNTAIYKGLLLCLFLYIVIVYYSLLRSETECLTCSTVHYKNKNKQIAQSLPLIYYTQQPSYAKSGCGTLQNTWSMFAQHWSQGTSRDRQSICN